MLRKDSDHRKASGGGIGNGSGNGTSSSNCMAVEVTARITTVTSGDGRVREVAGT